MSASPLDRRQAVARTRAAQIGVVALAACGGGIVAFGLPGVKPPQPLKPLTLPVVEEALEPDDEQEISKVVVDLGAVADRFGRISNRPSIPAPPPLVTEDPKGAEPPPPPPPPPTEDVKFLGLVHLGTMKMALVSKSDKQSFVSLGGKVGDETVSAITESEITIGGKAIKLTPKGADLVTRVSGSGSGVPAGMPGAAKFTPPGVPGGINTRNNPASAAAAAARAAAARAAKSNQAPVFNASPVPAAPFPDPARNSRYQQLLEKYRGSGEFKTEIEIAEAAMKQTDNEAVTGQLPGFDTAILKGKQ
ncbi:MAG: hypothetical protein JNK25_02550 [Phycisphaerae bacterium]|nr:hypothetical protein [Phycisphaerae bacterium]